ncbi:hypothetical protein FACS1894185_4640 [Betaproteobacteria bacterium]|nr:hypothetical protein FACS1894185_4640 [Betaproteobacteria bacterium]
MPVSTVTFIIIILSALAALVFAGGFIRGVKNAINGFRNPSEDKETPVEQNGHWGLIGLAFLASIVSIAGIGWHAAFIYAGPFLVIFTTLGVGVAFFIEKKVPPAR